MENKNYMNRLVDEKLDKYLEVFGAVSVEGPKWCGKTWTSLKHSNSAVYLDDEQTKKSGLLDLNMILDKEAPELIDEWHIIPQVWDKVRRKCDEDSKKGKYILTCSTELNDEKKKQVFHSGAGRIARIKMQTMSLYESKDSSGEASITDMYNNTQKNKSVEVPELKQIANLIVRGGFPANIETKENEIGLIPKSYIESVLDKDIDDDKKRDKNKMRMLIKSLVRNESTIVSNQTLIRAIMSYSDNDEYIDSRDTITDYLDVLERLYFTDNQSAFSTNFRSSSRIGKSAKRHLIDPSLACAALDLNADKLLNDLNTFGFLFESLAERDLKIYMNYLGGELFHFRDNATGMEVDSILEFANGDYATVEIKLGDNQVEEAISNLNKFYKNAEKKPKFMCVITANSKYVFKYEDSGIYVLPITALKP